MWYFMGKHFGLRRTTPPTPISISTNNIYSPLPPHQKSVKNVFCDIFSFQMNRIYKKWLVYKKVKQCFPPIMNEVLPHPHSGQFGGFFLWWPKVLGLVRMRRTIGVSSSEKSQVSIKSKSWEIWSFLFWGVWGWSFCGSFGDLNDLLGDQRCW